MQSEFTVCVAYSALSQTGRMKMQILKVTVLTSQDVCLPADRAQCVSYIV